MAQSQFLLLPKMEQDSERKQKIHEKLQIFREKLPCDAREISIQTLAEKMSNSATHIDMLPLDILSSVFYQLPIHDVLQVGR
jgi:hypothetical protein